MNQLIINEFDLSFKVYFTFYPGEPPVTHLPPEDCHEGIPAEVEISGVYLMLAPDIEDDNNLVEVLSDEVLQTFETIIFMEKE